MMTSVPVAAKAAAQNCASAAATLPSPNDASARAPLQQWSLSVFETIRRNLETCEQRSRDDAIRLVALARLVRVDLLEAYYYRSAAIAVATARPSASGSEIFKIEKNAALARLAGAKSLLDTARANRSRVLAVIASEFARLAPLYDSYLGQVVALSYGTFRQPATTADGGTDTLSDASVCANPNADAKLIRGVAPAFPEFARQQGAAGTAVIGVLLDSVSRVVAVAVFKSTDNVALDSAAVEAARESTFATQIRNCVPVEGRFLLPVTFTRAI